VCTVIPLDADSDFPPKEPHKEGNLACTVIPLGADSDFPPPKNRTFCSCPVKLVHDLMRIAPDLRRHGN
jgi:hypothetical protein